MQPYLDQFIALFLAGTPRLLTALIIFILSLYLARLVSNLLKRVLQAEADMEVVATASTSGGAVDAVRRAKPDIVTLDLQIDGGGIDAITKIMEGTPTPILVLSAAVQGVWATRAVEALAAGAADVLPKPVRWDRQAEESLRDRVRAIGHVRLSGSPPLPPQHPPPPPPRQATVDSVVAIAASTGGPAALATVLAGFGSIDVPVLVVQHLHADFMAGFVSWLDRLAPVGVKAARAGERVRPGHVYVAPGGVHLRLGATGVVVLDPEPPVIHRPSADELFASVAQAVGPRAVGVLLTGMGNDGAVGLLAVKKAGGVTIAQDQSTSAVYGMPQAAVRAGAVDHVVPLDAVSDAVLRAVRRRSAS